MTASVPQLYRARVDAGLIRADRAQEAVLPALERIRQGLATRRRGWPGLGRLAAPAPASKGCYIWGDVGRGKSMLMNLLTASLPAAGVRRLHFHAFLRDMHAAIHAAHKAGNRDPIVATIAAFAKGLRLLALDEMDVSDIGDAMIVDRVFRHLLDQGTVIVTTSNRPPELLYRDGLKRDLFLPFIALLRDRLEVIHVDGPQDWRRNGRGQAAAYVPLSEATAEAFDALWTSLAPDAASPGQIVSAGRTIRLGRMQGALLRASFHELCEAPLGPGDYLELAARFRVLFLDAVPRLGPLQRDAARRFVMLVDALYEARCGLLIRAETDPDSVVDPGLSFLGTARLNSRLAEMLGDDWLSRAMPGSGT